MRRKWHKFWALSGSEKKLFLQALFLLPWMALGLRLFGFQRWFHWLDRTSHRPFHPLSPIMHTEAKRLADLVGLAAWHGLYDANCLKKSLTLWWLLRRRSIPGQLRIGVRKTSEFEAHAWVELADQVLNDTPDVRQRFLPFDTAITPLSRL